MDELIAAQDVPAIERFLAEQHQGLLAGYVHPDDLRRNFARFSGTSPNLQPVIETWLERYPDSPFAHAAAAWNFRETAFRMRGVDSLRFVWPDGLVAFQDLMQASQHHGLIAFESAPDLIVASDLLFMNEAIVNHLGSDGVFELVKTVMERTPNRGTLYRATSAFSPNWGNDIGHVATLCDLYSDAVPSVDYASPQVCAADLVLTISTREQLYDRAVDILAAQDWIGFQEHQYKAYASRRTSPKKRN